MFLDVANIVIPNSSGKGDAIINPAKPSIRYLTNLWCLMYSGINSLNRGHGLGLSINKALIDLFDGHIDIKSDLGKGSDFTISIPESKSNTTGFALDGNELFFDDDQDLSKEGETF